MNSQDFVRSNNLKGADAVIMKKKNFGMFDHYVLYLGQDNLGRPFFVANYTKGIKRLTESEIQHFMSTLEPVSIDRFPHADIYRDAAVQRAVNLIGYNNYDLIAFNCEHFKNYVHHGKPYSSQVDNAGKGLLVGAGIGLFALLIGGLLAEED